jgi:hypothetical protein
LIDAIVAAYHNDKLKYAVTFTIRKIDVSAHVPRAGLYFPKTEGRSAKLKTKVLVAKAISCHGCVMHKSYKNKR